MCINFLQVTLYLLDFYLFLFRKAPFCGPSIALATSVNGLMITPTARLNKSGGLTVSETCLCPADCAHTAYVTAIRAKVRVKRCSRKNTECVAVLGLSANSRHLGVSLFWTPDAHCRPTPDERLHKFATFGQKSAAW